MKKLFIIALLSVAFSACASGTEESTIKATIKNLKNCEIDVRILNIVGEYKVLLDTTINCTDGKFSLDNRFSDPTNVIFFIKSKDKSGEDKKLSTMTISLYMFKGEHYTLKGSVDENVLLYSIKGSETNSILADLRTKYIDQQKYIDEMRANKEYHKIDSVGKLHKVVFKNMLAEQLEYVKTHLDSQLSGLFLWQQEPSDFDIYYPQISESVRTGIFKIFLDIAKSNSETIKNSKTVNVGSQSIDFTLNGIDGEAVTLSSLKGKHVLLYFWGSWCGWCIKGFPKLNQLYDDSKDKLEFVGIGCNDTEEAFKKTIENYGVKWKNYIAKDNITVKYGVTGYPTKILVDPDGKIVLRYDGEDPKFYEEVVKFLK